MKSLKDTLYAIFHRTMPFLRIHSHIFVRPLPYPLPSTLTGLKAVNQSIPTWKGAFKLPPLEHNSHITSRASKVYYANLLS